MIESRYSVSNAHHVLHFLFGCLCYTILCNLTINDTYYRALLHEKLLPVVEKCSYILLPWTCHPMITFCFLRWRSYCKYCGPGSDGIIMPSEHRQLQYCGLSTLVLGEVLWPWLWLGQVQVCCNIIFLLISCDFIGVGY